MLNPKVSQVKCYNFIPHSLVKIQYCGEHPWLPGSEFWTPKYSGLLYIIKIHSYQVFVLYTSIMLLLKSAHSALKLQLMLE